MLRPEDIAFQEFSARYAEARATAIRPAPAHEPAHMPAPSAQAAADAVSRHLAASKPPVPDFAQQMKPTGLRAAVQMLFARPQPKSPLEDALKRMTEEHGRDGERTGLKPR